MDLLTQGESRVAKMLRAVEARAAELEADPARVAPDEFERRCWDLGLAVMRWMCTRLWAPMSPGASSIVIGTCFRRKTSTKMTAGATQAKSMVVPAQSRSTASIGPWYTRA